MYIYIYIYIYRERERETCQSYSPMARLKQAASRQYKCILFLATLFLDDGANCQETVSRCNGHQLDFR